MKKIIALILALVMLGSVSVFAANAEIDVRVPDAKYGDNAPDGQPPYTELWLQVEATGQIDVTVPLVLVFKTNIDGGEAATGTNYAITNNSTADLAVTEIFVNVNDQDGDNTENPMALVASGSNLAEDQYEVKMVVAAGKDSKGNDINNKTFDVYAINAADDNKVSAAALDGGLFVLPNGDDSEGGSDSATEIDVQMKTGELSFITKHKRDDAGNEVLDDAKGVYLLKVTYTVAINTNTGIGSTITTARPVIS